METGNYDGYQAENSDRGERRVVLYYGSGYDPADTFGLGKRENSDPLVPAF
jgi:hypothetical protein